ncbi:BrxE family protein [Methylolobus aquaticus]
METYLCLRTVVGYLGEKDQHGWWPSSFFSASSSAFLQPVFPRSHLAAAYHGVVEAGRRLHDQHIGIGRVFHLFRLPEEQERELHEIALRTPMLKSLTESTACGEAAMAELARIAQGGLVAPDGPVKVGTRRTLLSGEAVEDVARHYHDAFRRGIRCFPYFTEA